MGYSPNSNDVDADVWEALVVAAGATVSASTKRAVVRFCQKVKDGGYWAKLQRVNLFCGSSLTAALIPLKAVFGDPTDTNHNFLVADYTETQAFAAGPYASGSGINGISGTTKYISTGFNPNTAGCTYQDFHMSHYRVDDVSDQNNGNGSRFFGSDDAGGAGGAPIVVLNGAQNIGFSTATATGGYSAGLVGKGFYAFSSQGGNFWQWNGYNTQFRTATSSPPNVGSLNYGIEIFAAGSTHKVGSGRLAGYTMGLGLTQTQMFHLAATMEEFQRELGRWDCRPTCLCFGDSISRGFGLTTAAQRWTYKVAAGNGLKESNFAQDFRRLRTDFPTTPFVRAGINCYQDIITYTKPLPPAMVYIMLGTNDCYDDPDNTNGTAATAADFQSKLETILQYLIDNGVGARKIIVGSPPAGTVAQLSSATKMGLYVTACQNAATNKGTRFSDNYTPTLALGAGGLQGDGIHSTASGHVAIAAAMLAAT